jgi:hypothetical protein
MPSTLLGRYPGFSLRMRAHTFVAESCAGIVKPGKLEEYAAAAATVSEQRRATRSSESAGIDVREQRPCTVGVPDPTAISILTPYPKPRASARS